MHVTILNHFYWPHPAATSQLMTELAEGLVTRGHRVTVITALATAGAAPVERHKGVEIRRVRATQRGKKRVRSRLVDYGTFFAGALIQLGAMRDRPDVILALTTPPLVSVLGQVVGVVRRVPVVSLVQDVYPDIAVTLGLDAVPQGGLTHRAWAAIAGISLRRSDHVIVLSEAMRRRIAKYGVAPSRVTVIHNWALRELDEPGNGEVMRLRYGFGDRFVVMYSGNMGAGHCFKALLAAAERLRDRQDIVFALVGEGAQRGRLEAMVARRRLDNVRLFPYAAREDLASSLASADLHLITMRDGVEGLLMPSKLYGILAAARPSLFIGPSGSAVRAALHRGQCGISVDNDDVDGVVASIVRYAADPGLRALHGANARDALDRSYDRERTLDRYEELLADVSGCPSRFVPEPKRADQGADHRGMR